MTRTNAANKHYLVECHALMHVVATAAVGLDLKAGDWVVLRFKGCEDVGYVRAISDDAQAKAIAIRNADTDDLNRKKKIKSWEEEALEVFKKTVKKHELPMRVVGAHAWADGRKVAFYFLSNSRLDFRKLHKEVGSALNCRVVIKQIGSRDHARLVGGLGPCGRALCCTSFLTELRPITLRTARRQNLFVNPEKISGMCGRLLCCLRYEDTPSAKSQFNYDDGEYSETDEANFYSHEDDN